MPIPSLKPQFLSSPSLSSRASVATDFPFIAFQPNSKSFLLLYTSLNLLAKKIETFALTLIWGAWKCTCVFLDFDIKLCYNWNSVIPASSFYVIQKNFHEWMKISKTGNSTSKSVWKFERNADFETVDRAATDLAAIPENVEQAIKELSRMWSL